MRYIEQLDIIYAREDRTRRKVTLPVMAILVALMITVCYSAVRTGIVRAQQNGITGIVSNAVSKEDIAQAKKKRDEAKKRAAEARKKVNELSSTANDLKGELSKLNKANDKQRAQYKEISEQLAVLLEQKQAALDEYLKAEENYEAQEKLFQERVSVMFEYQNKSTLEVLLESDSIAGFFTNMELITLIADADAQAVDQLQIALDDAKLQRDIKLKDAEEMQAIADEKQAELDKLASMIGKTQDTLKDVKTQQTTWEDKEDALDAEARKLDKELAKLQTQYNQQNSSAYSGKHSGKFRWPTNCTTITSPYGMRIHPVFKTKKMHTGIDIGAGYGAKIMAAGAGKVIRVREPVEGKNTGGTGYGNFCIIDHGNGFTTLYGHARNIYVKEGAIVSAGQTIGEVGSTGTSKGAHLHFEVRVGGTCKNPMDYLP